MALTVTFDTNTLDKVVRPERATKDPFRPTYDKVHQALNEGRIQGFFCETIVTLEGIEKKDRARVFGSTHLERRATSPAPNTVNLHLEVQQDRPSLHPEMGARVRSAMDIGMRVLRAPPRIGWIRMGGDGGLFYDPIPLVDRIEVNQQMATAINARDVGSAVAISLGNHFNAREGVSRLNRAGIAGGSNS